MIKGGQIVVECNGKNVPPLSWKIIINLWIDCLSFEFVFTLLCTTSENHSINW